jgi:hypothetical protein
MPIVPTTTANSSSGGLDDFFAGLANPNPNPNPTSAPTATSTSTAAPAPAQQQSDEQQINSFFDEM